MLLLVLQCFVFIKAEFVYREIEQVDQDLMEIVSNLIKDQPCSVTVVSNNSKEENVLLLKHLEDSNIPYKVANIFHKSAEEKYCNLNVVLVKSKQYLENLQFTQKEKSCLKL